jgi:hypothetical protein
LNGFGTDEVSQKDERDGRGLTILPRYGKNGRICAIRIVIGIEQKFPLKVGQNNWFPYRSPSGTTM